MTDRQPGAPGQYILTVSASEAQKILTGEPVTVTLVRDDKPLVDGTPYNKASVLPDDLAAKICPGVDDPTPAEALEGLRSKKISATLSAAGWSESGGQYRQTIPIDIIKGDANETVKSWPEYTGEKEKDEAIQESAANVTWADTAPGNISFYCLNNIPAVNIPIVVEVSR